MPRHRAFIVSGQVDMTDSARCSMALKAQSKAHEEGEGSCK